MHIQVLCDVYGVYYTFIQQPRKLLVSGEIGLTSAASGEQPLEKLNATTSPLNFAISTSHCASIHSVPDIFSLWIWIYLHYRDNVHKFRRRRGPPRRKLRISSFIICAKQHLHLRPEEYSDCVARIQDLYVGETSTTQTFVHLSATFSELFQPTTTTTSKVQL
jgi:hypothetical protein